MGGVVCGCGCGVGVVVGGGGRGVAAGGVAGSGSVVARGVATGPLAEPGGESGAYFEGLTPKGNAVEFGKSAVSGRDSENGAGEPVGPNITCGACLGKSHKRHTYGPGCRRENQRPAPDDVPGERATAREEGGLGTGRHDTDPSKLMKDFMEQATKQIQDGQRQAEHRQHTFMDTVEARIAALRSRRHPPDRLPAPAEAPRAAAVGPRRASRRCSASAAAAVSPASRLARRAS